MPMSPRLLRPRATGFHPEALDWRSRVIANGGTVSATTIAAVSKFCRDIDAAGIRSRFYRLGIFAGNSLSAALVPLYRNTSLSGGVLGNATDTNSNFVSGDYVETGATGGLLGNATSKSLNTGFRTQDFASVSDVHIAIWWRGGTVTGTTRAIGCFGASNDNFYIDTRLQAGGGNLAVLGQSAQIVTNVLDESAQSIIASRTSTTNAVYYKNGAPVTTLTNSVTGVTGTSQVIGVYTGLFSGTTAAAWFPYRLNGYSIGAGLSASQASAFHTAWAAFQAALARGL